jgi:hypothetical protein
MEVLDFLKIQKKTAISSDVDTLEMQKSKFKILHKLRHDTIHALVAICLGDQTLAKEKEIQEHFPGYSEIGFNQTPDIVFVQNNEVFIIDITITSNPDSANKKKVLKYQPVSLKLANFLNKHIVTASFCVLPDLSNLNSEFTKISKLTNGKIEKRNDVLDTYISFYDDVAIGLTEISLSLGNEVVSQLFENEEHIPQTQWQPELYKDSLKYGMKNTNKLLEHLSHFADFETSLRDTETIFTKLVNDEEIRDVLKETPQTSTLFEKGFKEVEAQDKGVFKVAKPTIHIAFASLNSKELKALNNHIKITNCTADWYRIDKNKLLNQRPEQLSILSLLTLASNIQQDKPETILVTHLKNSLLKCLHKETEMNIFCNGNLFSDEMQPIFEKQYHEHRESFQNAKRGHERLMSKREFAERFFSADLSQGLPHIQKNKLLKTSNPQHVGARLFLEKSGTNFNKTTDPVRKYTIATSCPKENSQHVTDYLDYLSTPTDTGLVANSLFYEEMGVEDETSMNLKKIFLTEFRTFVKLIEKTRAFQLQYHNHLVSSQLLHFTEMNTQSNSYQFVNAGFPNMVHIIRGGSKNRGTDVGQSFFSVFVSFNPEEQTSIFGEITKFPIRNLVCDNKQAFLCYTGWRRLSSRKLCFIKDQIYSTLSTGFDTWQRNRVKWEGVTDTHAIKQFMLQCYTFRTMVSLCTSQHIAELLMDMRYIFMSSLADYSNIDKLIIDKFKGPYKNSFHRWIVDRVKKRVPSLVSYIKQNPPKMKKPFFTTSDVRRQDSLGGDFRIKSLWTDITFTSMQDLFDDMFVYVHTMKEPSETFYENIKAINTILKFQNIYNNLDENDQIGIHTISTFKNKILSGVQVGCWSKIVQDSTRLRHYKTNSRVYDVNFIRSTQCEHISEINSTKACIPEYKRVEDVTEMPRKKKEQIIKNLKNRLTPDEQPVEILSHIRKTRLVLEDVPQYTAIIPTSTNRAKVHDCMYDFLSRNPEVTTTLECSHWNMKENRCRVVSDICIKAQYGAKREFYVINFGAKAMARITENIYKELCKSDISEMISIPGEKKLQEMDKIVGNVIKLSERQDDYLFYVNGDCTKWSACETMSSFISMNSGLKHVIGEDAMHYNNAVFSKWGNKEITIPLEIMGKTRYISKDTLYLQKETTIKSTQNFLQGMFNYSSSYKAVIATNFALHMYRKAFPNTTLHCSHMEHSDDYMLMIRCKSLKELEEFRIYHKLSQRLHGICDSEKKTNIQRILMEFISLFSFNGQMCYPNIKKLKEVGLNLSCNDYRSDAMSICSRVGESVRLGIPLNSCYVLQRIHSVCLFEAYSLSKNQRNSYSKSNMTITYNPFDEPLEMFGLPDCFPLIYSSSSGNPNNYRIWKYTSCEVKRKQIVSLFKLSQISTEFKREEYIDTERDASFLSEFFNPIFLTPTRSNKLNNIKKHLHLDFAQSIDFFEKHPIYTIMKPRDKSLFKDWLAAQYYTSSFAKAYTKPSRPALNLRLSRFVSNKVIIMPQFTRENNRIKVTGERCCLSEVRNIFLSLFDTVEEIWKTHDETTLIQALTCGQTNTQAYYETMQSSTFTMCEKRHFPSVSGNLPGNVLWMTIHNSPSILLQKLLDPETYDKDKRECKSAKTLRDDLETISRIFDVCKMKSNKNYMRICFKDIMSQYKQGTPGIVYTYRPDVYEEYIRSYLQHGLSDNYSIDLKTNTQLTIINPHTGELMPYIHTYKGEHIYTKVIYNTMCLYNYLCRGKKIPYEDFLEWSSNLTINIDLSQPNYRLKDFFIDKTIEIIKQFTTSTTVQLGFLFLKSMFMNTQEGIELLLQSSKFYEKQYLTNLSKDDETAAISAFGGKFIAHGFNTKSGSKNLNKTLVLETNTPSLSKWLSAYPIALYVLSIIKRGTMDKILSGLLDYKVKKVNDERVLEFMGSKSKSCLFLNYKNEIFEWQPYIDEYTLPIFFNPKMRIQLNNTTKLPLEMDTKIFFQEGQIKAGRILLYKMPVMDTRYFSDVVTQPTDKPLMFIDGIDVTKLLNIMDAQNLFKYQKIGDMNPQDTLNVLDSFFQNSKQQNPDANFSNKYSHDVKLFHSLYTFSNEEVSNLSELIDNFDGYRQRVVESEKAFELDEEEKKEELISEDNSDGGLDFGMSFSFGDVEAIEDEDNSGLPLDFSSDFCIPNEEEEITDFGEGFAFDDFQLPGETLPQEKIKRYLRKEKIITKKITVNKMEQFKDVMEQITQDHNEICQVVENFSQELCTAMEIPRSKLPSPYQILLNYKASESKNIKIESSHLDFYNALKTKFRLEDVLFEYSSFSPDDTTEIDVDTVVSYLETIPDDEKETEALVFSGFSGFGGDSSDEEETKSDRPQDFEQGGLLFDFEIPDNVEAIISEDEEDDIQNLLTFHQVIEDDPFDDYVLRDFELLNLPVSLEPILFEDEGSEESTSSPLSDLSSEELIVAGQSKHVSLKQPLRIRPTNVGFEEDLIRQIQDTSLMSVITQSLFEVEINKTTHTAENFMKYLRLLNGLIINQANIPIIDKMFGKCLSRSLKTVCTLKEGENLVTINKTHVIMFKNDRFKIFRLSLTSRLSRLNKKLLDNPGIYTRFDLSDTELGLIRPLDSKETLTFISNQTGNITHSAHDIITSYIDQIYHEYRVRDDDDAFSDSD